MSVPTLSKDMVELASNTLTEVDGNDHGPGRLWPKQPLSRRLVTFSLLGGVALLIFGALAVMQLSRQFAALENLRQRQVQTSTLLFQLNQIGTLQRDTYRRASVMTEVPRPHPEEDLTENARALEPGYQKIQSIADEVVRGVTDANDVERGHQLAQLVADNLTAMRRMVAAIVANGAREEISGWQQSVVHTRAATEQLIGEWQAQKIPFLQNADASTVAQLRLTSFVAYLVLGIGALIIFLLVWMLIRYVHMRDEAELHLRHTTDMLRSTRDMWLTVINTFNQGVAIFGYDKRLRLWNPRYAELQGIDAARLYVGMPIEEIRQRSVMRENLGGESTPVRFEANMERVRRGETFGREILRVDGVRIALSFHPMEASSFILNLSDMTRIRQAEQLARERAVRLEAIMNNVPDAIVVINASGSIESWNAGAERMFGYRAAEIIHRNVRLLMAEPHAGQLSSFLNRYLTCVDTAELRRVRELTGRRRDNTEFPIELRVSEMRLGDTLMFTGVARDITERRAVEQMKDEFISTVSHELRTPLTSLGGSLALLMDSMSDQLPEKARLLIAMAEKNGQRLARLINDILDLEKASAGRMTLQLELVPLLPLLQNSLELNQSYADRLEVTLLMQSNADSVMVRADEARLLQVMANLLSNAVKNSPANSQALVEVNATDTNVRVTVHDSGPGIAEEFKARVFQRFAQMDSSDARRKAGTGLGLAITKQLVEQHGGRIGFDTGHSKIGDGRGASFWFELPLVAIVPSLPETTG